MKNLNNYIIEKFKINKDTKVSEDDGVLMVSRSISNSENRCSFYYYEIESINGDILKLKNHARDFKINHDKGKYYGTWGMIYAEGINEKEEEGEDYFHYIYKGEHAIKVIKEALSGYPYTFDIGLEYYKIEKPIGIRNDNITDKEWLEKILSWIKNGKGDDDITEKLHINKYTKVIDKDQINEEYISKIKKYLSERYRVGFEGRNSVSVGAGRSKSYLTINLPFMRNIYKSVMKYINENFELAKPCSTNNQSIYVYPKYD